MGETVLESFVVKQLVKDIFHANHISATLQVLGKKERSLQALLQEYAGVAQDKSHQLDDWRQRYSILNLSVWQTFHCAICCLLSASRDIQRKGHHKRILHICFL